MPRRIKISTNIHLIVLICLLSIILITILFFRLPLPLSEERWSNYRLRHRMVGSLIRTLEGEHMSHVYSILGESDSYPGLWPTDYIWVYQVGPQDWRHIIIFFNKYLIVEEIITANPLHVLG